VLEFFAAFSMFDVEGSISRVVKTTVVSFPANFLSVKLAVLCCSVFFVIRVPDVLAICTCFCDVGVTEMSAGGLKFTC